MVRRTYDRTSNRRNRRLDAATLEPLATRRFTGWSELLLLPVELNGG